MAKLIAKPTQKSDASAVIVKSPDPSLLPPIGTLTLCLVTIGVSIAQSIADDGRWAQAVGVIPASVLHLTSIASIAKGQVIPVWLTLFTYAFLHGGWWHVLPNMAALWVFGAIAEPVMGTRRYLLAYFAFGAVGAFGMGLVLPHSLEPIAGASLAISGILGAYSALRFSNKTHRGVQSILVVVVEAATVLGVAAWLVLRTVPVKADLICSIMYHFIPFMAAWFSIRALEGIGQIVRRRVAEQNRLS